MGTATICAGDLKHRVTLQEQNGVADGFGGIKHKWDDVVTTFMKVEPLSGREQMHADQMEAPVSHKFTMRYRPMVKAAMRLKMAGPFGTVRLFNIRFVRDLMEAHQWLEIIAEENVAAT